MAHHWFWWIMTMTCVVWYSTITIYVAIKGGADIKHMLARLDATKAREEREERENKR